MAHVEKMLGEAIFSLYTLRCSHCSSFMESELRELPGIVSVELNDAAGTVIVRFDPRATTTETIRNYLRELCQAVEPRVETVKQHSVVRRQS